MRNKASFLDVILVLLIALLAVTNAHSQQRLGLRMDNYQGINSIFVNPSLSSTQALPWNLNLISVGAFVDNNYTFIENSSVGNIFKKTIINRDDQPTDAQIDLNEFVVLDFNNDDGSKFAEVNAFATGPSFMAHLGNHHFGVFMNYRMIAAEQRLDEDLGYYTNQRLTESISLDRISLAGAAWREIGGHYTYSSETNFGHISVGANLKSLTGYEAIALETQRTSNISRLTPDIVEASTVDVSLIGTSAIYDTEDLFSTPKGKGWGFDFGVSLVIDEYEDDYKMKFGLAINDIGSLKFDQDIEGHILQSDSPTTFDKQNYLQLTGIRDIIERASNNVLGNSTASLDASISSLDIQLPTTIVLNADYKIMDHIYVGGLLVQRLPQAKVGLETSNLLGVFPRYESKWIGASLPISLVNFENPHVGLSLRLAYLTIGTDQLGTIGKQKERYSADAYISLQFFGFDNNGLFNNIFQKKGGKATKCYDM